MLSLSLVDAALQKKSLGDAIAIKNQNRPRLWWGISFKKLDFESSWFNKTKLGFLIICPENQKPIDHQEQNTKYLLVIWVNWGLTDPHPQQIIYK